MKRTIAILIAVFVVLAGVVGVLFATAPTSIDVRLELAKALLTLMSAVLITGVLSFVLGQRSAYLAELENRGRTMTGALRNLKAGYERVQVARFYLIAHRTAKTFQEQIPAVAEARSYLHLVQREQYVLNTELDDEVQEMLNYLDGLANEYRDNYTEIAENALREDTARENVRNGTATLRDQVKLSQEEYPSVFSLTDGEAWKTSSFNVSYTKAKKLIQNIIDQRDWSTIMERRRPKI